MDNVPFISTAAPTLGPVAGMDGGYEPCKDGASRMVRGNLDDQWQHAFHPRSFPDTAGREDILHVDRQVYGVGNWLNPRSNCHSAWVPVLDERETDRTAQSSASTKLKPKTSPSTEVNDEAFELSLFFGDFSRPKLLALNQRRGGRSVPDGVIGPY